VVGEANMLDCIL